MSPLLSDEVRDLALSVVVLVVSVVGIVGLCAAFVAGLGQD